MKRLIVALTLSVFLCSCVNVRIGSNGTGVTIGGSIGASPTTTPVAPLTVGPLRYTSRSLHIINVLAAIKIIVEPRSDTELTVIGRGDVVSSISARDSAGVLTVDGGNYDCGGVHIADDFSYSFNYDSLVINGVACRFDETTITVRVPDKTSVELRRLFGNVDAGDTHSSLYVDHIGTSDLEFGDVTDLTASMSGTGSLTARSTSGKIELDVTGTGNVAVNGGRSSSLDVDLSGTGNVRVAAEVEHDARLDVTGTGNITLTCVRGRIEQDTTGTGRISILNDCP